MEEYIPCYRQDSKTMRTVYYMFYMCNKCTYKKCLPCCGLIMKVKKLWFSRFNLSLCPLVCLNWNEIGAGSLAGHQSFHVFHSSLVWSPSLRCCNWACSMTKSSHWPGTLYLHDTYEWNWHHQRRHYFYSLCNINLKLVAFWFLVYDDNAIGGLDWEWIIARHECRMRDGGKSIFSIKIQNERDISMGLVFIQFCNWVENL